ncbi:hypothetical protein KR093_010520 [Drosophila rubida]|uniref:Cystatin domain-containing protein n=1 Tax=Drosophila rubida TaxID=30044 RepID=A0AAD4PQ84_9MUSC|nr:hypothetical protein KR093_010520 [Drosophila rubida]
MIGIKLLFLTIFTLADVSQSQHFSPGAVKPLNGPNLESAVRRLSSALKNVASGGGPNYEILKVNFATTQVVQGTLDTYNVKLTQGGVIKKCEVKIWSQPWMSKGGNNIKIACNGQLETDVTL